MSDVKSLYQKAISFFKQNDLAEAANLLEEALNISPNDEEVLEALGVIYGKQERFKEGVQLMKKISDLNPDHVMAHTNLSQFYMRLGMIHEAEAEQAEARRLSWKAELRAKKLSESEIEKLSFDRQAEEAVVQQKIEKYKKVIEYDPNDVLGYFTLGTAYAQGKFFLEAAETFKKGIEKNPSHSPSYSSLGEVLEALGKKEEAMQIYRKGIPVADKNGDIIPQRKMESRLRKLINT